jgi:hypothetical protein
MYSLALSLVKEKDWEVEVCDVRDVGIKSWYVLCIFAKCFV